MQLIDPLAQRGWDQVHRHRPAVPVILRWLGDLWSRPSWPRVVRIQAQGGPDAGQRVVSIGDHILVADQAAGLRMGRLERQQLLCDRSPVGGPWRPALFAGIGEGEGPTGPGWSVPTARP